MTSAPPPRPGLVCLVSVGRDAHLLQKWLDAVRPLADAVVALDRSTCDATRALLEGDPLVQVVLTDPPTPSGATTAPPVGHLDGGTRDVNRLIAAAETLHPQWLLWLRADERVAPGDVGLLRDFLANDALAGLAYGLRTDGDGVAYRLFAYRAGQRVLEAADYAVVPDGIPPELWVTTTMALEPLDAVGPARQRSAGTPVIVPALEPWPADDWPVISAVVLALADHDMEQVVRALLEQSCPEPFEVLVVTAHPGTSDLVHSLFATATVVDVAPWARPDEVRNAGLARARGDYVMFVDPGIRPAPGALAAVIAGHDDGDVVLTYRVANGVRTTAGWASYLLDRLPVFSGQATPEGDGRPGPTSCVRNVLVAHGGYPLDGHLARQVRPAADAVLLHDTGCRTVTQLVRHHLERGAAQARTQLAGAAGWRLLPPSAGRTYGLGHLRVRVSSTAGAVQALADADLLGAYTRSRRLITTAAVAEWAGFWLETSRAARRRGLGLDRVGFAGSKAEQPAPGSGPEERAHTGIVLDALYPLLPHHPGLACVPVALRRATRRRLTEAVVAGHLRRCRDVEIVAVTGSAGKTTVKDLVSEMLAVAGPTIRTRANENGLWGVPATLLAIRRSDRFAVLEVGLKRGPGEMRWMAGLFRPRVAVLTGIGEFHTEVLGSLEAVAREKRALLERLDPGGTVVVNADDPHARAAAAGLRCRVVLAGRADIADVRIVWARSAWPHGTDLELDVHGARCRGRVGVYGDHLLPLVAMAVAAADAVGVAGVDALDAAGAFSPRTGRFSPTPGPRGSMLVVDDWKSRVPHAVAAIEALGHTGTGRRVAVLGEVQVDAQTTATYRPVAEALVAVVDLVIAVGRCGPPLAQLLKGTRLAGTMVQVADAETAAHVLAPELGPGDVALLHGAGHHDLELVSLRLDPEADPAWLQDWRQRPATRVGRPVIEVLTLVDPATGVALVAEHGAALTYAGSSGHTLSADGRLCAPDDAALVAQCTRMGVAPFVVLRAAEPEDAAAAARGAAAAVGHAIARGHRGVLLDVLDRQTTGRHDGALLGRLARDLRAAGLLSGVRLNGALIGSAEPETAVDLCVIDVDGPASTISDEWSRQVLAATSQGLSPRSVMLSLPVDAVGSDVLAHSSASARNLGVRGLVVAAASLAPVSGVIGYRLQIRQRARAVGDAPR